MNVMRRNGNRTLFKNPIQSIIIEFFYSFGFAQINRNSTNNRTSAAAVTEEKINILLTYFFALYGMFATFSAFFLI